AAGERDDDRVVAVMLGVVRRVVLVPGAVLVRGAGAVLVRAVGALRRGDARRRAEDEAECQCGGEAVVNERRSAVHLCSFVEVADSRTTRETHGKLHAASGAR